MEAMDFEQLLMPLMPPAAELPSSRLSREEYIKHLASQLDGCLLDAYLMQRSRRDPKFFSSTITWFKRFVVANNPHGVTFAEVLNCRPYDRYYGTFAAIIEMMVFYPYHFTWELHIINRIATQYDNHLDSEALHDILNCTFKLIVEDGLDPTLADYYGLTPAQHMLHYYLDMYDAMPSHIRSFMRPFQQLFRHGSKIVVKQQRFLRNWLQKKREKRAVRMIEDWWFEVVNSPYTRCGSKMMEQRAVEWHAKAVQ